jgi:hypothetical protein
MPPPPASVGAAPSVRPPAVVLAVTSLASPPLRTVTRARPRDTWKKPLSRGRSQHRAPNKTAFAPGGHVTTWAWSGDLSQPHGNVVVGEMALDLAHRVVSVMQDRCEQHSVGSGPHGRHEVLEPSRAA